jgi:hypothetical protein
LNFRFQLSEKPFVTTDTILQNPPQFVKNFPIPKL